MDLNNDFIPALKGSAVAPGELGIPNIVPVGNRQAQGYDVFKGGASYWMDLSKTGQEDIYSLARQSIGYTSPFNISGKTATEEMARGYGISLENLKNISDEIQKTQKPGSIVFSRIEPEQTSGYLGGGERWKGIGGWKKCYSRHKNADSRKCNF
jgi:hypothetical protein